MPRVLITTEALRDAPGRHADVLHQAGLEIYYPVNPQLTRGLSTEEETINEWRDADAVIAGGEFVSANVLSELPKLRVIARTGVGYDRIDVPSSHSSMCCGNHHADSKSCRSRGTRLSSVAGDLQERRGHRSSNTDGGVASRTDRTDSWKDNRHFRTRPDRSQHGSTIRGTWHDRHRSRSLSG